MTTGIARRSRVHIWVRTRCIAVLARPFFRHRAEQIDNDINHWARMIRFGDLDEWVIEHIVRVINNVTATFATWCIIALGCIVVFASCQSRQSCQSCTRWITTAGGCTKRHPELMPFGPI